MEETIMKQISISSDAFNDDSSLPVEHTCDGEDRSPALSWNTVPAGTGISSRHMPWILHLA
jgi:phosphatidylethanolamine-binding protein (PEBP) family uncharacterized protein